MAVFYIGVTAIVGWVVAAEKLGIPTFGDVTGLGRKVSNTVVQVEAKQNLAGYPSDESQEIFSPSVAIDKPKLLSPSVAILEGEFIVDQLLNQRTSKPVGTKTMVNLQVENLTRCKIVNLAFELDCKQGDGKTATFDIDRVNFSRGLMPEAAGVVSLVCEPGNWETIAVTIVSVESEEESELTVVGPYVIKKDDRLVMNE